MSSSPSHTSHLRVKLRLVCLQALQVCAITHTGKGTPFCFQWLQNTINRGGGGSPSNLKMQRMSWLEHRGSSICRVTSSGYWDNHWWVWSPWSSWVTSEGSSSHAWGHGMAVLPMQHRRQHAQGAANAAYPHQCTQAGIPLTIDQYSEPHQILCLGVCWWKILTSIGWGNTCC